MEIGCRVDEFDCGDEMCISASLRCDGMPNCPGREDEKDCRKLGIQMTNHEA